MRCEDGIHYFFSQKGHCVCGERTNEAYKQGRKDAIDEVLVLLTGDEFYQDMMNDQKGCDCTGCIRNWLEGKLKGGG